YDPVTAAMVRSAVVDRDDLAVGDTVAGPAVIVESQTTTVLGSHHVAIVQGDHTLRVLRSNAEASQ
ncbi:MAG: hypothetical protein ACR2P0_05780, partial [Acidimicrobiales bacterium]